MNCPAPVVVTMSAPGSSAQLITNSWRLHPQREQFFSGCLGILYTRPVWTLRYRIHNVFHVSLLRHYRSDGTVQPPMPSALDPQTSIPTRTWTVEKIRDHESRKLRDRTLTRFLVKWAGFGHEHNSWVDEKDFPNRQILEAYLLNVTARTLDPSVLAHHCASETATNELTRLCPSLQVVISCISVFVKVH